MLLALGLLFCSAVVAQRASCTDFFVPQCMQWHRLCPAQAVVAASAVNTAGTYMEVCECAFTGSVHPFTCDVAKKGVMVAATCRTCACQVHT